MKTFYSLLVLVCFIGLLSGCNASKPKSTDQSEMSVSSQSVVNRPSNKTEIVQIPLHCLDGSVETIFVGEGAKFLKVKTVNGVFTLFARVPVGAPICNRHIFTISQGSQAPANRPKVYIGKDFYQYTVFLAYEWGVTK